MGNIKDKRAASLKNMGMDGIKITKINLSMRDNGMMARKKGKDP